MKKALAVLTAAVTAALTGTMCVSAAEYDSYGREPQEPTPVCGDVNNNGTVDTFDLVLLRGRLGSKDESADIDGDGTVDEYDLKILSDFLLSAGDTDSYSPVGSVRYTDRNVKVAADNEVSEDIVTPQMKFSTDLLKKTFRKDPEAEEKNLLISPLSVNVALGMTANGAAGETLEEYRNVLGGGMELASYNDCMADMIARLTSSEDAVVDIADSIWFRQQEGLRFSLKQPFLSSTAKYFGADAFGAPFDDQTVKDINKWVSHGTHGVIKQLFGDRSAIDESMMVLINTLYFNGKWAAPYERAIPYTFSNYSGSKAEADFLFSEERYYIEGDGYTGFRKDYRGGEFSFVGILPDEGKDIYEFVQGLDPAELHSSVMGAADMFKSETGAELRTAMPKLDYKNSMELQEYLKEMGLANAMSDDADYSGMTEDMPLVVGEVIHKTAIELNETGTVAAAVTAVTMKNSASAPQDFIKVYLDRPYVYMIMDNQTGLPLFIGAVTDLNGTQSASAE